MADNVGEIFLPSGADVLLDQFLRDIRLAAIEDGQAEPPVQPGTDWHTLGTALANIALIGIQNSAIGIQNQNVLNAVEDPLDSIRTGYGLPEVVPTGSSGKIVPEVSGNTVIQDGAELVLPNGLRIAVVGTFTNPVNGTAIDVAAIDTGEETNLAADEIVRFANPPVNVATDALVSRSNPLRGGTDEENDERKRRRILNRLQNTPAGGNWAHLREIILENDGSIQDVFVYPALGGPASAKVVPIVEMDLDGFVFTRAATTAQLKNARDVIHTALPIPQEIVIGASADQDADFAFQIQIPDSTLSGGNGQGWVDAAPWPPLIAGDNGRITVTAAASGGTSLTIDAVTATIPVDTQTTIAWWSSVDRRFYTSLVVSHTGDTGAWVLTLQTPLLDRTGNLPVVGDFVGPAAINSEAYGDTWLQIFQAFGTAEQTVDANRLPRAARHPLVEDESPSDWSDASFCAMPAAHPEITDFSRSFVLDLTPNVPPDTTLAPAIFVPKNFGLYKL